MIAEAACHSDGGKDSAAFAFAIDDGELQIFSGDRFVGPAGHVRLAVKQSLTNITPVGTSRVVQCRVLVAQQFGLKGRLSNTKIHESISINLLFTIIRFHFLANFKHA